MRCSLLVAVLVVLPCLGTPPAGADGEMLASPWAELTGAKPEGDAQPPSWADPTGNAAHGDLPASAAVSGAKPVSF